MNISLGQQSEMLQTVLSLSVQVKVYRNILILGCWPLARTTPVLPFLLEISRFAIILTWMSDIYEFFKSITLLKKLICKSWLVITQLGAWVTLIQHLHHQLRASGFFMIRSVSKDFLIVLPLTKKASNTSLKIHTRCNF